MALARLSLKMLPGIDRPAIVTRIPTIKSESVMLDLGANVDCTPEHLFQFAVMGDAFARAVSGLDNPSIGILNIGAGVTLAFFHRHEFDKWWSFE